MYSNTSYSKSSPVLSRTAVALNKDIQKADQELFTSVKKAVNTDETAPKQKHVRVATLYTWDFQKASTFWEALKMQPIMADDVQCFKALITIHKVMRDGHYIALEETMRQVPFLDSIYQIHSQQQHGLRGYSMLIRAYVQFIKSKLEFHTFHPEFTANLDYEEYRALRKVHDPNEGYNTISELMTLQDKLDELQNIVFQSFRPSSNNECRIASLVPLVEESFGIYKFITSMLFAMHATVASHAALEPLRTRFVKQYHRLRSFYAECSLLRYLTSLISVPQLPPIPPDFINSKEDRDLVDRQKPREKTPPPEEDLWSQITSHQPETNQFQEQQQMMLLQQQQHIFTQQQQNQQELMRREQQELMLREQERQELMLREQERQEMMLREQQLQLYNQQQLKEQQMQLYNKEQQQAEIFQREIFQRDQKLFQHEKEQKLLQDQLLEVRNQQLQSEKLLNEYKQKYENISTMYAQLRQEHLSALQQQAQLQSQQSQVQSQLANVIQECMRIIQNEVDFPQVNKDFEYLVDTLIEELKQNLSALSQSVDCKHVVRSTNTLKDLMRVLPDGSDLIGQEFIKNLSENNFNNFSKLLQLLNEKLSSNKLLTEETLEKELNEAQVIINEAITLINTKNNPKLQQLTEIIAQLIRAATECQLEINMTNKNNISEFYKKNSRWIEGLITAAKAVAAATKMLTEFDDDQHLVVCLREVSASTAQLLQASRVKSDPHSLKLRQLETISAQVKRMCTELVATSSTIESHSTKDSSNLLIIPNPVEFKRQEMERQVEILDLEQQLTNARLKLSEFRRVNYKDSGEYK